MVAVRVEARATGLRSGESKVLFDSHFLWVFGTFVTLPARMASAS